MSDVEDTRRAQNPVAGWSLEKVTLFNLLMYINKTCAPLDWSFSAVSIDTKYSAELLGRVYKWAFKVFTLDNTTYRMALWLGTVASFMAPHWSFPNKAFTAEPFPADATTKDIVKKIRSIELVKVEKKGRTERFPYQIMITVLLGSKVSLS